MIRGSPTHLVPSALPLVQGLLVLSWHIPLARSGIQCPLDILDNVVLSSAPKKDDVPWRVDLDTDFPCEQVCRDPRLLDGEERAHGECRINVILSRPAERGGKDRVVVKVKQGRLTGGGRDGEDNGEGQRRGKGRCAEDADEKVPARIGPAEGHLGEIDWETSEIVSWGELLRL